MIRHIDERRLAFIFSQDLLIPYLTDLFFQECQKHLSQNHSFHVALAGGSTPKKLYEAITKDPRCEHIPWNKVYVYYGDERAVSLDHPDSNYKMSLDAGFAHLQGIHLVPMQAFLKNDQAVVDYEKKLPSSLDLVFLGMGDDGHTASLFPNDPMLNVKHGRCAIGYVESKQSYRMTLTLAYLNQAKRMIVLVTGANKREKIKEIFSEEGRIYPAYMLGTKQTPAEFVLDEAAAALI